MDWQEGVKCSECGRVDYGIYTKKICPKCGNIVGYYETPNLFIITGGEKVIAKRFLFFDKIKTII